MTRNSVNCGTSSKLRIMTVRLSTSFLSKCGCTSESLLFHGGPWNQNVLQELPTQFHSDPQAMIAFLSNERNIGKEVFAFPHCFRGNKDVMMVVLAKWPSVINKAASPRLLDDEDFVQAALHDELARTKVSPHISQRLLKDKNMLLHIVTMGYCTPSFTRAWLAALAIAEMDIKEQKEIGHVILLNDRHADELHEIVKCFLSACSQELRDDASFMLPIVTLNGLSLKYCSHRLRGNSDIVRTAVSQNINVLQFAIGPIAQELRDDVSSMLPFVKLNWQALKYCSDRLRSNTDVVSAALSQSINAYQYAKGPIRRDYNRKRNVDSIVCEIQQGLDFESVPKKFRTNKAIRIAAVKAGRYFKEERFPAVLKNDKDFILDMIKASKDVGDYFTKLPRHLQLDEDVAKALLQAGDRGRVDILQKVPSLLQSLEAMLLAVKFPEAHYYKHADQAFPDLLAQCPFHIRDNKEFMLTAFKSGRYTFQHASERLRSDRDFVSAALALSHTHNLGRLFFARTTDEFQVQNLDLIVEAIESGKCHHEWLRDHAAYICDDDYDNAPWFARLNPAVLSNKQFVMAFIQKGWLIPEHIPIIPLFGDEEIMFLAVQHRPADLKYASKSLQQDRKFILKLVTEIDSVLQHAPTDIKYDKNILLAALVRGTVCHCFDCFDMKSKDFEFLCEFASELRSDIATHKSYKEFLRGIVDPACRSLFMLNQGIETDVAFKKKIAEFAGIRFPMSTTLETLEAALTNLEKFDF